VDRVKSYLKKTELLYVTVLTNVIDIKHGRVEQWLR
jgi:hypothetical protein